MLQSWCDLWQECKQPCKLIILWPRTFVRPTSSLDSYIGQGETPRLHSMGWKRTCPLPSISSQRKAFKVLLQSLLAIHQLLPSKKRVADLVEVSLGEAQLDRPGKGAGVVSKCEGHEAVKHKVQSGRRNYSNLFCVTTAAQRIVHTNAVDKLVPNPRR